MWWGPQGLPSSTHSKQHSKPDSVHQLLCPWLHLSPQSEGHERTVTGLGQEKGPALRVETRQKERETHFPRKFPQAPSGGWQGHRGLAPPIPSSGQPQLGWLPYCLPSFHLHWPSDPCKGFCSSDGREGELMGIRSANRVQQN